MNFGGLATYKDVRMRLVPAMHSTFAGYSRVSPRTKVTVLKPGESTQLSVGVSGVASA